MSDCTNFLSPSESWAEHAARLGWDAMALFGCAPRRPLDYSGSAGLIWAINGGRLAELHRDWAVIDVPVHKPLTAAGRVGQRSVITSRDRAELAGFLLKNTPHNWSQNPPGRVLGFGGVDPEATGRPSYHPSVLSWRRLQQPRLPPIAAGLISYCRPTTSLESSKVARSKRASGACKGRSRMYVLAFVRGIVIALRKRYRPELHYMRGPGPKWFERHGRSSSAP